MKSSSRPLPPLAPKLHPAEWVVQAGAVDDVLVEMDRLLVRRRQRRKNRVRVAVATAACIAAAFWLVPYLKDTSTVATQPARQQTLALADGSQAELNAQTNIRTDFRYGRRTVHLTKGEAFFSVAKDSAHPFLVETPAGTVRVTGTKFNVRLAASNRVEVALLEGSVAVTPSEQESAPVDLAPGQLLDLAAGRPTVRTLTPSELEHTLAWRDGRAVFDGDTLADAAARFADYHGVTIAVNPGVASLHLGGSYPLADLQEFLDALETTLPVRVQRETGTYRITSR